MIKILGIFENTQFMGKTCESLLQIATIKRAPKKTLGFFLLRFVSVKVIKAIICFDRNSLARFFRFYADVSIVCDYLHICTIKHKYI